MALSEEELYACYRRMETPLYNVLYRWLWQAEDCQDVLHDAFVRIWARRARVDGATIERLVWTTALNLARNRLRWRKLWPFDELNADAANDDDPLLDAARLQSQQHLRAALDRLPYAQRQVLLLAEFGDLSVVEIAQLLDIPPGTVGSRRHNALARLRHDLQDSGHAAR